MFDGKSKLKPDEVQYSNLEAVKEYIKERVRSLQKYASEQQKETTEGFRLLKHEYGVYNLILSKLEHVISMHPITEIKIIIELRDTIGLGSHEFKNLRELMSFLKTKEKIHIADALGYDQINNKLK